MAELERDNASAATSNEWARDLIVKHVAHVEANGPAGIFTRVQWRYLTPAKTCSTSRSGSTSLSEPMAGSGIAPRRLGACMSR